MKNRPPSPKLADYLFRGLSLILNSEVIEALGSMWRLARRILAAQVHEGLYEVLEHEAELELCDSEGKRTIYRKRQRVRFLQNNTTAYQDMAWGDGEIFAEYECAPGVAVDRYQEGHRWHVLISLRETKNRNDIEEFHIRREIKEGFTKPREAFQTEINHKTHHLLLKVNFPKKRLPERVVLVEQNLNRSTALGPADLSRLPDGRMQAKWETENPRLFEAYILQWHW